MTSDPLASIRALYNVPARVGMAVTVDGRRARILGNDQAHLLCESVDSGDRFLAHPTWRVQYWATPTPEEARDWAIYERLARERRQETRVAEDLDLALTLAAAENPSWAVESHEGTVTAEFPSASREGTDEQMLRLLADVEAAGE